MQKKETTDIRRKKKTPSRFKNKFVILVIFINFIQTYLNKSVFTQCTATGLTHLLPSAAISYQISARDDRLLHLVSVHCETIFQFLLGTCGLNEDGGKITFSVMIPAYRVRVFPRIL